MSTKDVLSVALWQLRASNALLQPGSGRDISHPQLGSTNSTVAGSCWVYVLCGMVPGTRLESQGVWDMKLGKPGAAAALTPCHSSAGGAFAEKPSLRLQGDA